MPNLNAVIEHYTALADRWEEERGVEDFTDYITSMKQVIVQQGYAFVKMVKTNMRVDFSSDRQVYKLWATPKQIKLTTTTKA